MQTTDRHEEGMAVATKPSKALPDNRAALEHLLVQTDQLLAAVEPVEQLVRELADYAVDVNIGGPYRPEVAESFRNGLKDRFAAGIPPHHVLDEYLDEDPPRALEGIRVKVLETLLDAVKPPDRPPLDWSEPYTAALTTAREYRQELYYFVGALRGLQAPPL